MNILFYIPELNQQMGGIKQYAHALLKTLSKDTENNYFIFHEAGDPEILDVLNNNPHLILLKINKDVTSKTGIYWGKIKRRITRYAEHLFGWNAASAALEAICNQRHIDIIHCPYQYLPKVKMSKAICTIHDVQELHFPEYFSPEDRALRAANYLNYIKNADKIIVSYEHVKSDIIKYFHTPPDKVEVCLLEMSDLWIGKYSSPGLTTGEQWGITGDFIIYPANTWPHKNHQKLLEAIVILKNRGIDNIKIVCTGHKTGYFDTSLNPFIERHHLESQVIFPGVLDEFSLYSLYKTCIGVVVPTMYEAGSFPLMEAILLSVPVICSNVTSLPETIGDENYLFDPNDSEKIAEKIARLWGDKEFRKLNTANCEKQSVRLRNTHALNIIQDVYNSIK